MDGNISVWSMPWCDNIDDLNVQQPGFVHPSVLKDLWCTSTKTWDANLIRFLFSPQAAVSILNTSIFQSEDQDFLCWKHKSRGLCSSKSAYKILVQEVYSHQTASFCARDLHSSSHLGIQTNDPQNPNLRLETHKVCSSGKRKADWFSSPRFIRSEPIVSNSQSICVCYSLHS